MSDNESTPDVPSEEPVTVEAEVVEVVGATVDGAGEPQATVDGEPQAEAKPEERAEWKYKTEFGIVNEMRHVIQLTIAASEAELKVLRRKLRKLQYGGNL